jgi:hypothetical protein
LKKWIMLVVRSDPFVEFDGKPPKIGSFIMRGVGRCTWLWESYSYSLSTSEDLKLRPICFSSRTRYDKDCFRIWI